MSQKKEKYARSMEKRVGKLEDRVDKMDTELTAHAIRLYNIEDDLAVYNAAMSAREEKRIRAELAAKREAKMCIRDSHIRVDDTRNADAHRARIMQFNNELLRDIPHTREDFIEILEEIDFYERFCEEHKDYKNNRCTHAIANIGRVYDDRLRKHDFL